MSWFGKLKNIFSKETAPTLEQTNNHNPIPVPLSDSPPAQVEVLTMSQKGKMFLCGLEGICLSKYYDSVGVATIGVGITRTEIPDLASWPLNKQISIKECFELLDKSLARYVNAVNKVLKVKITQSQFDALVSICFNIGTSGLTKSTFMKRINAQASERDIFNAIMMWNKPPEILGRRRKEASLFTTGVYAGDGKANLFPVSKAGHPLYARGKIINLTEYI